MKKSSKITLLVIILLICSAIGAWFAPVSSKFIRSKVMSSYTYFMSKKGVEIAGKEYFIPMYQSKIGYSKVIARQGYLETQGMFLKGPESFSQNLIFLDKISYDMDLGSLSTDDIVINTINLSGFRFNIEDSVNSSNVELFVKNIITFLIENMDEFKEIYLNVDLENSDDIIVQGQELENLLFGEDFIGPVSTDMQNAAMTFLGGNTDLVERLIALYDVDSSEEYEDEFEYWNNKNITIDNIIVENCKVVYGDIILNIPDITLKNLDLDDSAGYAFLEENKEAIEAFSQGVLDQEDSIYLIKAKLIQIETNLSELFNELIGEFFDFSSLEEGDLEYSTDDFIE